MTLWPVAFLLVIAAAAGAPRGRRARTLAAGAAIVLSFGIWRPVLSAAWTGDPVFPFGIHALRPDAAHEATIAALTSATRANAFSRHPAALATFPVRVFLDGEPLGLGHLFGPVFLMLLPVMLVRLRRRPGRGLLFVAVAAVAVNAATTQMGRFLLPVFPLFVALSAAALEELGESFPRRSFAAATAGVAVWLLFCVGADAAYARKFLRAGLAREDRATFLGREGPDYLVAQWTDRQMRGRVGRVAVFFRHLYYLGAPSVNAAPATSWEFSADRISDWDAARRVLVRDGARWVLKTGGRYPPPLSAAFLEGERTGGLVRAARARVENFVGNRIEGRRASEVVELLEVRP